MTAAQRLALALDADPKLAHGNPLDIQRFAINWLLGEIDKIEKRIVQLEGDDK